MEGILGKLLSVQPGEMKRWLTTSQMGWALTREENELVNEGVLLFILGSNWGGVRPERGLRGGGRRGWCEEWARSG